MKITIVTGPYLPIGGGPSGAVEKRWLGMAKWFVKKGHTVNIYARGWKDQASYEKLDNISIYRGGGFTRSSNVYYDIIRDLFYSAIIVFKLPASDILVTNTFWLPILAQIRNGKLGKIVVNVARFPKKQMILYKNASRLSCVSTAIYNAVIAQSPSVSSITKVIPNPIEVNHTYSTLDTRPRKNSFNVIYTGRIHPEKGLHLLSQALENLLEEYPNLKLSLIGSVKIEHGGGGSDYIETIKSNIKKLPLTIEPNISNPIELYNRILEADYYCYPSLADYGEAFGIAPLEAMALGIAPIISNLNCFKEFAKNDFNCIVFDHRTNNPVNELTSTFRKAFQNPEKMQELGKNAKDTSKKFSYDKITDMYIKDWEKLILE